MDIADAAGIAAPDIAQAPVRTQAPTRSFAQGFTLLAGYGAFYLATLAGALAPFPVALNVFFAIGNGVFIATLFIIGHDCAHGSLVTSPRWNTWLARLCFVPVLHSASLWRLAHNKRHHGGTNLKGFDPVWAPMGLKEYRAASPARRALERLYRGGFGPVVYYHTAIWLPMLLLPLSKHARREWRAHVADSVFVFAGGAALIGAILFLGHLWAPARPLWQVALVGWAVPFASWSYFAALTTYLNHTHPEVAWYDDDAAWRAANGALRGTVHVKMPVDILPLYSDVMAHTMHHVNPSVPVYALPHEQAHLKTQYGAQITEYTLSVDAYRRALKVCKLFDFERMCWTDFDGLATSLPLTGE